MLLPRSPLLLCFCTLALTACGGPTTPITPNVITDAHASRSVILVGQTSTVSASASSGVVRYTVAPESAGTCYLLGNQQVTARVPTTCVITVTAPLVEFMDGRRYPDAVPQQVTITVERGFLIDTIAGTGVSGDSGDGGPAVDAQLVGEMALATDTAGRIYIADSSAHRIRRIDPSGIITTVAGNGTFGSSVDGTPAVDAPLGSITAVAVDAAGTVYFADASASRVRKIDAHGLLTTVAGSGPTAATQDGLPATSAYVHIPKAITFGPDGTLYIAESGTDRVRKVNSGVITTVAGTGTAGFSGDGGPARQAQLNGPTGLAVNGAGTLYIADYGNRRIRTVDASGAIRTVAGTGMFEDPAMEDGLALQTAISPYAIALDSSGALYMTSFNSPRIRRLGPDGTLLTVAGSNGTGFFGDGGPATLALLAYDTALAVMPDGRILVGDAGNRRVRALTP